MRPWILTPVILCAVVTASAQQPGQVNADTAAVAQGNNVFAFDLYHRLAKKDGNLFFSPYSISTALGMTYAGARGETADQMAKTLHFGLGQERLHRGFAGLIRELNAAKGRKYELFTANALWGQRGVTFLPDFLRVTKDDYGAGLKELDFAGATEAARKTINAWVEEQTRDKIRELIQPKVLSPQTMLVLTNAIYFKAAWQHAFREGATKNADFHLADGTKVQVPTMHQYEELNYFDGGTFALLELPYERHELDMLVLVPTKGTLADLEKSLTSARLDAWRAKLRPHEVEVALPRFKVTSAFNLKQTLSEMGMPIAFEQGKADFRGMTTQANLWIDEVIHKAFVDVNEKGTEAAAATAVIMKGDSASPQRPRATFRADRPFIFLVRDRATGSTLFLGRVADPR